MIKQQIDADIKKAMLGGDKQLVSALRNLKSAILYAEVAAGKKEEGLPEADVIGLLQKEAKKRQESAEMYKTGGAPDKAAAEEYEKKVIDDYLPEAMSEEDVEKLIDEAVVSVGELSRQTMGQVIGFVKSKAGGSVDGGTVAKLVQKRL